MIFEGSEAGMEIVELLLRNGYITKKEVEQIKSLDNKLNDMNERKIVDMKNVLTKKLGEL